MAGCRNCGFDGPTGARYCARCGTGVGDDVIELLALGATIRSDDAVTYGQGQRRWPVVVLALAVLGWLLWPASVTPAAEGSAAQTTATTPPRSSTSQPATTRPATTGATTTRPAAGSGPSATDARVLSSAITVPDATSVPPSTAVVGAGGPLVGRPTGLSLLVGNLAGLRRVDLDTGTVTAYDVSGWPLAVAGSWLVLGNTVRGWLRAVPLADPGTNPQLLGYTPAPDVVAPGAAPAHVWFLDRDVRGGGGGDAGGLPSGTGPGWRLVDLDSGRSLDEAPVSGGDQGHHTDDPAVGSSNAGGVLTNVVGPIGAGVGPDVYGDEFRKVFDGRPLAVSDEHVLAQTCSLPTRCRLRWLDRSTWQEVDRPVPEGQSFWAGWLSPDGRILAYFRDGVGAEVFDVVNGRVIDLGLASPDQLAVAPDGRYLAAAAGSSFVIHDLATDRTVPLDLGPAADHRLLFVDN